MSATAPPISPTRFAAALKDLGISSLHGKAAELRNSIIHLEASNKELKPFADEGDEVCKEAIAENDEVMSRMEHRILLLRAEVERRGMPWHDEEMGTRPKAAEVGGESASNGAVNIREGNVAGTERSTNSAAEGQERTQNTVGQDEEGVFL
jgi:hypothetical protein